MRRSTLSGGLHSTLEVSTQRRIYIGDVHGCFDELCSLLEKVGAGETDDVILVGDLVRKGPKSAEVVKYCRKMHFFAVKGNHEERLFKEKSRYDMDKDLVDKDSEDRKLIEELEAEDFEWLQNLPYTINVVKDNVLVVHAGLIAGKKLEDHSVFEMTEMRGLVNGEARVEGCDKDRWINEWKGPATVVYGN